VDEDQRNMKKIKENKNKKLVYVFLPYEQVDGEICDPGSSGSTSLCMLMSLCPHSAGTHACMQRPAVRQHADTHAGCGMHAVRTWASAEEKITVRLHDRTWHVIHEIGTRGDAALLEQNSRR
jgi:hypothetical protein